MNEELSDPLVLKPVIKELARTQVCFPDIKLLVDRISIVTLSTNEQLKENRAYRLYLSDGEKTVQGMMTLKIASIFRLTNMHRSCTQAENS